MSAGTAPRVTRLLAGVDVALAAAIVALVARAAIVSTGEVPPLMVHAPVIAVVVLMAAAVGFLVDRRHPGHLVGRGLLGIGLLAGIHAATSLYSSEVVTQGWDMPLGNLAGWLEVLLFPTLFALGFGLVPLVFPDGRLPGPRWRAVAIVIAVGIVSNTVGAFLGDAYAVNPAFPSAAWVHDPFTAPGLWSEIGEALVATGGFLILIGLVATAASLVVRYRRSTPVERRQLKWFVYFGIPAVAVHIALVSGAEGPVAALSDSVPIGPAAGAAVIGAIGIAILRHHLYDIDLVINKTLVYGALAALIGGVYVGVVVGVGHLLGTRGEPNTGLTLVATAVVAFTFQPARDRLQRVANRLVFGRRATPYQVLTDFSRRLGGALDASTVLPRIAETAARAVGASCGRATLFLPDGDERRAVWGEESGRGPELVLRVEHRGELIGEIAVAKPPGDPIQADERRLLERLADQSAVALQNAGLTAQLENRLDELTRRAAELESSRRRLMTARDRERRRVEAEITRRTSPVLESVRSRLERAISELDADSAAAGRLVDEARVATQTALEELRGIARGIFPPLLADRGLVAAIEADARKLSLPVAVEVGDIDGVNLPDGVTATAYFCCREALENAVRHAGATGATVQLSAEGGYLVVSVIDDGRGFDPGTASEGTGIHLMSDRVAAAGGRMRIDSHPGETRISLELPLPVQAAEPEAATHAPASVSGSNSDLGM